MKKKMQMIGKWKAVMKIKEKKSKKKKNDPTQEIWMVAIYSFVYLVCDGGGARLKDIIY